MTPLRKRMTEDLQLKGYSPQTQRAYLHAVQKLARHYGKSPAKINEEELRAYFLHLTRVEHCAHGTLKIALGGIKFCLAVTLQRHWPALGLIRAGKERKLPVVLSRAEVRAILGCVRAPVYHICLNTIYACGLRISEGTALQVPDVDGERKVLRVRGKGNKQRQVPLAEPTLESLRAFWKLHLLGALAFPGGFTASFDESTGVHRGGQSAPGLCDGAAAEWDQKGGHRAFLAAFLRHASVGSRGATAPHSGDSRA